MKRKAILLLLSICMTCSALVGCSDNGSTAKTTVTETNLGDVNKDGLNIYDYLTFLDEFSVKDENDDYQHYIVVQNISDMDMDFTLYVNAYNAKGKKMGLAHGQCISLSPNDTFVVRMSSSDIEDAYDIDHVEISSEKFYLTDNAYTKFGFDSSLIEYSSTLNEDDNWVYVTATNNGTENACVEASVVFYKDGVPVDVAEGMVSNSYWDDKDHVIKPGDTETNYFRTPMDFDDYKVYMYARADF